MSEEEYAKVYSPVEEWLEQQSDEHADANAKETHAHEFKGESMNYTENDRERLESEIEYSKNKSAPRVEG